MAQRYLLLALGGGRRLPGVLLQQLLCGRGLLPPRPCLAQVSGGPRAGRLCMRAGLSVAAGGGPCLPGAGPGNGRKYGAGSGGRAPAGSSRGRLQRRVRGRPRERIPGCGLGALRRAVSAEWCRPGVSPSYGGWVVGWALPSSAPTSWRNQLQACVGAWEKVVVAFLRQRLLR